MAARLPQILNVVLAAVLLSAGPAWAEMAERLARHGLADARVGFHLVDLADGTPLATRSADSPFMPASTVKLITATAAMGVLGPAHRFRTSLLATGQAADGALAGDLYLKGGGDPLLAVQDLMALAEGLRARGVKRITGEFHYDATALPSFPRIDAGQPAAAPYNAGLSALSLDFNRIRVRWETAGDGAAMAALSPAPGAGRIVAAETDPGAGRPFDPVPGGAADVWALAPRHLAAPTGEAELPVHDPAPRTAEVFRDLAAATGIELPAPTPGAAPANARALASVESPPLARLLRPALAHSNNVVSELLGLAAARKLMGRAPQSLQASSAAVLDWLAAEMGDLERRGLNLPNHSGLSAAARVTPKQMLAVVRHWAGRRRTMALLPAGGWRDSFSGRFRDPFVAGRVWGKTGTMHYATGMVGVLFGRTSGRRRAFALYLMDDAKRAAYDADPAREAAEAQARAADWIERAKALEEELAAHWVEAY